MKKKKFKYLFLVLLFLIQIFKFIIGDYNCAYYTCVFAQVLR